MKYGRSFSDFFVKTNEMRGHQIKNELLSLSPNSFESLQLYFSKFKALVLQLKQCGIEKKDDQLVLDILFSVYFDLICHKTDSSNLEDS